MAREHGGGRRLLAYFTGKQGAVPDAAALRDYLDACLPAYMVPALFIALPAMPVTPNGKRDLNALPDPESANRMRARYEAPNNALEKELAEICAAVLRVPRVGVTDNFFQVGGDSILSLQLVTRANRAGISLTTAQVFELQTVQAMAANVQWRRADSFGAEVGWLQSWTDPALLAAFALGESRYRLDAGEVLAAALARAMLAGRGVPLRLTRVHDGGNEQYETLHAFEPGASAWEAFAPAAKAALRRESEAVAGEGIDACMSLRESAGSELEDRPHTAPAPLQLAATLMPHALTLAWTADSRHYTEERLRQLSAALAQGLLDLAANCAAKGDTRLQVHDFPAAGLDQDALEELLAELNGGGLTL